MVSLAIRPAYIVFSIPKKPSLIWTEDFENIKFAELEELIVEYRSALYSLEAERAARLKDSVYTSPKEYYTLLEEKAYTIKEEGALRHKDELALLAEDIFLKELKEGNVSSSQTRESRKDDGSYLQFLWLIGRIAGPAYTLLFIYAVSKRKFARLSLFQSADVVKYIA